MAQESSLFLTPWIQEIELPSQYHDIPNQSFYLDRLGHLFLGKENGLTIVNGNRSLHLHMNGPVYVTSGRSDTLYYTSENDLGYLVMDDKQGFHPISIADRIPAAHRTFIPSAIISSGDHIFIETDQGIYLYSDQDIQFFPFHNAAIHLLHMDGEIYLSVQEKGLMHWSGECFVELIPQDQLGGYPVVLLAGEHKNLNLLTDAGYLYSIQPPKPEMRHLSSFPAMKQVSCIDQISDELIMAAFPGSGITILDHQGRTINMLGTRGALPSIDIIQIHASEDHEIWVMGPHSLHKISYPSSLKILEFNPSETGRIQATKILDNSILLGSSHGLFQVNRGDPHSDRWLIKKLSPRDPESIHLLEAEKGSVFAGGSKHLYLLRDQNIYPLDEGSFTGIEVVSEYSLIASNEKGIFLYSKDDGTWNTDLIDPSLASSHSIVTHNGTIYFLSGNGVYRLSNDLRSTITITFDKDELLFHFILLDNDLYLVGRNRVYCFDLHKNTFLPLPSDSRAKILSGTDMILSDEYGHYWIKQHDGKYHSVVTASDKLELNAADRISFPVLQELGEIINLEVRDSTIYISGKDKISIFNLKEVNRFQQEESFRIEWFRSKETGELNLDLPASSRWFSDKGEIFLPHVSNDIEFYLAGLEFQTVPKPLFRFRVPPELDQWSNWTTNREIRLNNLGSGKHVFEAQVQDLYGRVSGPVSLHFQIRSPFYTTWYAYTIYVILLLFGLFFFRKWRLLSYQQAETRVSQRMQSQLDTLTVEMEKSDKLMAELLPEKTVAQLKSKGKAKWDKYERATVLFSDIQGFTRIAEEMNPEILIDELDKFFFHFDSVVDKYNIEKIKTIGDAYMAAGGIPEKNSTNPIEVVLAALEMQSYMQQLKSTRTDIWDLRIGIHTGPVIAGVVGHKKVSYDIWGDTVNTASRMESSGMPGKVNISGTTYGIVKEYFICEYRGKLPVKYKGNIDMYFVNGLRPELSVDLKGIPNKRFFIKLQLLRLVDLEEKVFKGILEELSPSLYFHKLEHARRVYNQAFLLCRSEEIEQEERLLIRTASLMLFTGLTQSYTNFENRSSVISRETLPIFKYSESQIDHICNLILSTKQPFNPHNRLEKVIIDAKMEFLGRPDYITQSKLLYQEMKEAGIKISGSQFIKEQIELQSNFHFFTLAAQRLREVPAKNQIASIEQEKWI